MRESGQRDNWIGPTSITAPLRQSDSGGPTDPAIELDCHEGGPALVKRSVVFTNRRSTKEARFICCTLD
jgi:hypothetical protein